jgi:hypothetical protein
MEFPPDLDARPAIDGRMGKGIFYEMKLGPSSEIKILTGRWGGDCL